MVRVNEHAADGLLVFADDVLVAVLSRFDGGTDEAFGRLDEAWVLEAGFGRCSMLMQKSPAQFRSVETAQEAILRCLASRPQTP